MIIGVPKETFPGERRVAVTPDVLNILKKSGMEVLLEAGAGVEAGYPDTQYTNKGASIAGSRREVFAKADVILQVRALGANPVEGLKDIELLKLGQVVIGFAEPLTGLDAVKRMADAGVAHFAMELLPRITRAQSMDILSSMATIAGYKAVLLAATTLPRMFPMSMTAAGTITPARVFVIGAGVAGLQAIASAKRLGAVVKGYDVRPAVKEQVESLGAKFVEMELQTATAEDKSGYARELGEEFYHKQRELMSKVVAESDVVITTAAIPGKKSPVLVTADMVQSMAPGSVIVDLAAERGGNCELTRADETVVVHQVTILGPTNLPSTVPYHASQMYSKNIMNFVRLLADKAGALKIDTADEIVRETLVTQGGDVVNARVRAIMAIPAPATPTPQGENK
jgi:NAD(P) transhydrogenase subunit alpha